MRPYDVMVTGMGGQGVVTCGRILATAAASSGWRIGGSEKRGGAQRGGAAEVLVRCIPSQGLPTQAFSAQMPPGGLDLLIGLEPIEALRRASLVSEKSLVLLDTTPVDPVLRRHTALQLPTLLEIRTILEATGARVVPLDLVKLARERWNKPVLANLMALGYLCASGSFWLQEAEVLEAARTVLGDKPTALAAFETGKALY